MHISIYDLKAYAFNWSGRLMNKKNEIIIISLIILSIVILSVFIFMLFFDQKETTTQDNLKPIIDNRISPLTNQTLVVTVHRIRKKGIINQMTDSGIPLLKNAFKIKDYKITSNLDRIIKTVKANFEGLRPGFGWDEKPLFSYAFRIDDFSWESPDRFNSWDTEYMNQCMIRDVEEERTFSEFEFTVNEKIDTKSLFGKTTNTVAMDSFTVTYDYRNGTWTGEDYLKDDDGYGHYNGSNYEIWFTLSQTDYDGDNIPYWAEINLLGTDPRIDDSLLDPDKDNCSTSWEYKWGYDPFVWNNHTFLDPDNDGIQNKEEYQIAHWLSNPYQPEIYIECDWMDQTPYKPFDRSWGSADGWTHELYTESKEMIIERFNEHGITVHVDDGCMYGGGDIIPFDKGDDGYPMGDEYSQESGIPAAIYDKYFTKSRKGIFRYVAICYKGGYAHPQDDRNCYDCILVPMGKKFYINTGACSIMPRTKRIAQALSIFHEIGHSCGFSCDYLYYHALYYKNRLTFRHKEEIPFDEYPGFDYISSMSYEYYYYRYFDFSDGSHGPNDTNDWANIDLAFFQRSAPCVEGLN